MKPTQTRTNKRKWIAVGGLGAVTALIALGILSGTLARYTYTEPPLTDTARVATFDVGLGNKDKTFRLFDTILDTNGGPEENVKKAGDTETAILAPGTQGSFELLLYNNSEVNVEYTVSLSVDSTDIPLEFCTDGTNWDADLANVTASDTLLMNGTDSVTVQWRWVFNNNRDAQDTQLGLDAAADINNAATVTATASVVFDQID